jgi:uncharacterized repeat protein (TIGR01451 family)
MTGWLSTVAAVLCTAALAGCAGVPNSGIDPSGDHVFLASTVPPTGDRSKEEYYDEPLGRLAWDDVAVELQPRETVASVGSEVVLIAGVCGPDGYLRTNRRLEWSIDPGSVGQFVAVGQTGFVDLMLGDFNRPRKITNTFAIGSTLRSNTRLNRGTCRPEENVYVLRGQGWISLTSPLEGTSSVTVFAPEVYAWDARLRSARIHWVDAQWRFPPPAINPAGSRHVFTTAVIRQTNQAPCQGWRIRYEIAGGPPAGFAPDGAQVVEAPTDSAGQASVEIFQKEPRHGTNKICIQVIRPGDLPGANSQRLVVGSGTTMKTWTGADLAVKKTGPPVASPGSTVTYRIAISNPGDLPAKEVVATDAVPEGMAYLGSSPLAELVGRQLQWRLGEIGARQQRTIDVSFRAEKQGSIANCCEVVAAGGLKVADCATTTVTTGSVEVRVTGPTEAAVGSSVRFTVTVRNLSPTAVRGLVIKDRLDAGLENPAANQNNAIERTLGDLAAGASQQINVTLRVARPGRLCHTVEVIGNNVAPATAQSCLVGVDNQGGATPNSPTPGTAPPGGAVQPRPEAHAAPPALSVKKTISANQLAVGETARFTIEITNNGSTPLENLKVLDRYDPVLVPVLATDGYRAENGGLTWTLDSLPAGKTTQLGIHCTCQSPSAKTCNRVRVTTADGGTVEDEACLEIREPSPPAKPPPTHAAGGLTLSVIGLRNPVAVNKELTYEIRVRNEGTDPYRQVEVTATVPDGMLLAPLGTGGPDKIQFTRNGNVASFSPVAEIKPGELLVYRVRAQAKKPGRELHFHVEARAQGLPQPLVQETTTEVF